VSFLAELRRELARAGIRGGLARRIELELADHLACDPQAYLGPPAEIADRFASELRVVRTRRAAIGSFAALATCAAMLLVAGFALNRTSPTGHATHGTAIAGLGMVVFAQIAFVAGVLALLRGVRGRDAGDLRLAQRRALVALAAGAGFCVSVAAQSLATQPMSLGWHALALAIALAPIPLLAAAGAATRAAAEMTPSSEAVGLAADLPRPVAGYAPLVLVALGTIAVAGVVFQGVVFEGSGWEGIIRGGLEASGLVAAVVLLGGVLGLRR
jgi:hypothetical protein